VSHPPFCDCDACLHDCQLNFDGCAKRTMVMFEVAPLGPNKKAPARRCCSVCWKVFHEGKVQTGTYVPPKNQRIRVVAR
jgi:hypothetical protein